jgi:hypothetical protein
MNAVRETSILKTTICLAIIASNCAYAQPTLEREIRNPSESELPLLHRDGFAHRMKAAGDHLLVTTGNGSQFEAQRAQCFRLTDGYVVLDVGSAFSDVAINGTHAFVSHNIEPTSPTVAKYSLATGDTETTIQCPALPPVVDGSAFGLTLEASQERLFVGDIERDTSTEDGFQRGAVFVYDAASDASLDVIVSPDTNHDGFGRIAMTVADRLVIGAIRKGDVEANRRLMLFHTDGSYICDLKEGKDDESYRFGWSVATDDNGIFVVKGPVGEREFFPSLTEPGRGGWMRYSYEGKRRKKVAGKKREPLNNFGGSVTSNGIFLFVGSSDGPGSGTVRMYNAKGKLVSTVENPDPDNVHRFGTSVRCTNQWLLVRGMRKVAGFDVGAVFVYRLN